MSAGNQIATKTIKPTCRSVKGELKAWSDACDELHKAYHESVHGDGGPQKTYRLTLVEIDPVESAVSAQTT